MNRVAQETSGYREVHLADVVDQDSPICYGIVLPGAHVDGGVPVIKVKDIAQGGVRTTGLLQTSPDIDAKYKRSRVTGGDILLSIRGTVGRLGVVPDELAGANITQDTARIRISCSETRAYVYQALQSDDLQVQIRDHVVGQAVKGINIRDVKRLKLLLPIERYAQKYIAKLLRTQDTAIQKTEQLITAKQRLLHQLRESKFQRLGGAERTKLHAVTREYTARNGTVLGRKAVMAVTKQYGMRPMREETIAANIERYKVVRPGAFAYNPMRLNIGSIAMSHFATDILVSPDYVVFECDESKLLPGFLNHLRFCRRWTSHFQSAGNGSVRIRIYYDDLGAFTFDLPPLDVQKRIVRALDAAVLELEKLKEYAEALKVQKHGLMQKLLTGQWRLPVAAVPSPPAPLPQAGEGSKSAATEVSSPLPLVGEGGRRPGEGSHD